MAPGTASRRAATTTDLDVANRDTWTVTHVRADGSVTVASGDRGQRVLPAEYVREHVELAYATTAHGAQGSTTTTAAHLVLDDHTTAASAYVGDDPRPGNQLRPPGRR